MGRHLRQNDTNTSEIYIGHPIYISDIRYLYRTSDIQYPTSARARARARAGISDVGYICILDVQYIYQTSDIYIGRPIYNTRLRLGLGLWLGQGYQTLDIYIYWMSDIDFGNIGGILS